MNCFICLSIHCFRIALHHTVFEPSSPSEKSLSQRGMGSSSRCFIAWEFFFFRESAVVVVVVVWGFPTDLLPSF